MLPLIEYIKHPKVLLTSLLREYGGWIPDKQYLQILYYLKMGKRLNLKNPQTFSEKLQWLKLYNRKPEYIQMVDKYAVKDYVARIIGKEYVIPTIGVWDKPHDIDFDSLPNRFVLKTTHGGGSDGVVICKDKTRFDKDAAIARLKRGMEQNIYKALREWPYKDVTRRIIAEEYLSGDGGELVDYKFFCFNGAPEYCQVIGGRNDLMTIDFFDMNWVHQPFHEPKHYPFAKKNIPQPNSFGEMKQLAKQLSDGIPFIRIDFYEVEGQPQFGELTFFPTSGIGGFKPMGWDLAFGKMIKLN